MNSALRSNLFLALLAVSGCSAGASDDDLDSDGGVAGSSGPGGAAMGGQPVGMAGMAPGISGSSSGGISAAGVSGQAGAVAGGAPGLGGSAGSSSGAGATTSGGRAGSTAGNGRGGSSDGGRANSAGTSGAPGASGATAGSASTGAGPTLPGITGTCPTFTSGTATIGGLGGVLLQVGAKKQGTGSLLFYWHGTGSSASEVNSLMPSAVRQEILDEGGIIVSFGKSLGTGGDCSGTSTFSKDDFKVADLIAACAVRDHGIDPRRIYTTGCSAGGLQAGCMGAMRSSYIAATVPNSGGEVTRQPIQDPAHVPAVMTMHGGSSDRVVVSFATTSATHDAHMKSAGAFVVNCDHGGGHCRAPAALYAAGWEFMKAHPFGVEPSPYAASLPASFPSYCMKY